MSDHGHGGGHAPKASSNHGGGGGAKINAGGWGLAVALMGIVFASVAAILG